MTQTAPTELLTFGLIPGASQPPESMQWLAEQQHMLGHRVLALETNGHVQGTTFEDSGTACARQIAEFIAPDEKMVLVGFSQGASVAIWTAQKLIEFGYQDNLDRLMMVGGGIHNSLTSESIHRPFPQEHETSRNTQESRQITETIETSKDGQIMTVFQPQDAVAKIFFPDADKETAEKAFAMMRPQCRMPEDRQPILPVMPHVPIHFIIPTHDNVVRVAHQIKVSRAWFGVQPVLIDSDHMPNISQPAKLARLLGTLASGPAPPINSFKNAVKIGLNHPDFDITAITKENGVGSH